MPITNYPNTFDFNLLVTAEERNEYSANDNKISFDDLIYSLDSIQQFLGLETSTDTDTLVGRINSLETTVATLSLVISAIKSIRVINQVVSTGNQFIEFTKAMTSDCIVLSLKVIESDGAVVDNLQINVTGESTTGFTIDIPVAGTLKGYAIET